MTDTSPARTGPSAESSYPPGRTEGVTGWSGWVVFPGMMLVMLAVFQAIIGLVAIFDPGYYLVAANGLVVNVDYTTQGWVHLILGLVAAAAGVGLIAGNVVPRVLGVVVARLSAILNLTFITIRAAHSEVSTWRAAR